MPFADLTVFGLHWWSALGWLWLAYGVYLAGWIVLQKRSPASTLAWVVTLTLMPLLGLLIYRYFGPQRVRRQSLRRMRSRQAYLARSDVRTLLGQRAQLPLAPDWAASHSRLVQAACELPVSSCRRVDVLRDGAATLAAITQAIEAAREHVHLEYYIFEPDETGLPLLALLARKAAEGARVRLLVDAVGSPRLASRRGRHHLQALREAGGEFGVFHPARIDRWRPLVNLRTHRKIVVCDARVGFAGGINITSDENDALHPHHAYRDTHLRLEGAAVNWLQYLFLQDWAYAQSTRRLPAGLFAAATPAEGEPAIATQVIASGPDTSGQAIHRATLHAIGSARQRVWLTTPYFVPTEPTLMALTNAALRGVDVRLMVPQRCDSRLVGAAARSYYDDVLRAGIRVWEYGPRLMHAKTMLVDDRYALIGSANFDYRSFLLNFELSVALFDADANAELARHFEADLAQCREIRQKTRGRLPARLAEAGARLLSPLL